jgi:D-alanyl-D-alanine dipeptidase
MWSSVLLGLMGSFPGAQFVAASPILRDLRMVKSHKEIEILARAGAMADAAFARVIETRFSGQSERELQARLGGYLREAGLSPAPWGPIVASGPHSASPHHTAGDREIGEGDAVLLDFGGTLDGYQADITRTLHVGPASEEFVRVYQVVRRAQQRGFGAVRPGVAAEDVDKAAREEIEGAGYGTHFIHRTGHGIGLEGHEEPYIIAGNALPLRPGMTFSVEPGIYLPDRFGVRIEDIVAVTDGGARRLNDATRKLVEVE